MAIQSEGQKKRSKKFEKLLEPFHIGSVKTRNRIIKTGAGMFMWHEDDMHMNENILALYESIARGGVGLLIVESPVIDYPLGRRWRERYRIDDDKYIKGLSELVQVIKKHGCPTFMQMNHDGPWETQLPFLTAPLFPGPPIASSPVSLKAPADLHNDVPRELTITEIQELVDKFASAAVRAEKAGFQGVDINSASSHLLHNFLSPFWNRRQDSYGGSTENRTRFLRQIIGEIKKRLGKDFPISVCINGMEMGRVMGIPDGKCLTPEESRKSARLIQEAGADALHIRSHWLGYHVAGYLPEQFFYPEPPIPLESFPREYDKTRRGQGANTFLAEGMKKTVSIPIMVVGRFNPELGERILQEGKADLIGMTRRLLADPDLPNKLAQGREEDIAPCTACESCLFTRQCRINAFLGTKYNTFEKTLKEKKVLIAGGGPAGMEAARVAALRGHKVTIFEKSKRLGGLLSIAALVKGTEIEDLPAITRYLKRQITGLGVEIRLGEEVNLSLIEKIKPEVVIWAAGGIPVNPDIAGINSPKVISSVTLHRKLDFYLRLFGPKTLRWLTNFYLPIGKKVVIIGSAIQGCELGEFLTKKGRQVTIVDTAEVPGAGMKDFQFFQLYLWFQKKGVALITGVKNLEITDKGLTIVTKEGTRQTLEADNILPATPLASNLGLFKILEGKVPEIYAIGDCQAPKLIVDAIADGSRIARAI